MKTKSLARLRSATWLPLAVGLVLFISACSPKGAKEIVGKWKEKEGPGQVEFQADGRFIMEGGEKLVGKYKLVSSERLKVELDGPVGKLVGAFEYKIKLEGDTLVMTDPDGQKGTLQRVK